MPTLPTIENQLKEASQLTNAVWAALVEREAGRREAEMVRAFEEIPRDAGRVIFFPRAAGGQ